MDLGIAGEGALCLASTRGIGFGCAKALAAESCRVVLNGRDEETGAAAAATIGPDALFVAGDVADEAVRAALFEAARAHLGTVSILLTNADGPPGGPFVSKTLADWRAGYEATFLSAVDMARRAVPDMIARGFGRIVSINSMSAKEPSRNTPLGNALKAGLVGAMATLAREIAETGVTVNSVLPGLIDTELLHRFAKFMIGRPEMTDADAALAILMEDTPTGRLGTIEEMGALCAFLASRHAGYITGQAIAMDGAIIKSVF